MKGLKTIEAVTMAEAIDQVKRQLGRDAVILHTRTLKRGGLLGLGCQRLVEVTAAAADARLPTAMQRVKLKKRSGSKVATGEADGAAMPADRHTSLTLGPASGSAVEASGRNALVLDRGRSERIAEPHSPILDRSSGERKRRFPGLPSELVEAYIALVQAEVAEEIAIKVVERIRREVHAGQLTHRESVRKHLAACIESMLPVAGPIRLIEGVRPAIIALVGPTGVGKTTTTAKLAANLSLRQRRKVGLVTIDTHRIAAVEQLRTYAEIIGVPFEAVATASRLGSAVDALCDRDVVLLDTAGCSRGDDKKLSELKSFLQRVKPHETHLVLSSTCSRRVLSETLDCFAVLGVDRVIFTKLDEAVGFGAILSCLTSAQTKLSYVTAGQDVPGDIEVGRGRRVADLIVNDRSVATCAR